MSTLSLLASVIAASSAQATEITVYNQGFALVKESRQLQLNKGFQRVAIEDVATQIETDSVGIRSVSAPGSFSVLEQNYQYDLISPQAILLKAVGSEITLNRVNPDGSKERIVGTLLSAPGQVAGTAGNYVYSGMVLQTKDGRILLSPTGEIEVTSIPDGLISRPTLMWELECAKAGANTVELSYLTGGVSWSASYVLALDQSGSMGDVKGWVTMNNGSGMTFKDAKLKLLAGEVERNRPRDFGAPRGSGGVEAAPMTKADFAEEQFADYHLYTLGRPATVRNNEQKQLSLLEGTGIKVQKRLVIDPMRNYQGWRANEGEVGTGSMKPQIRIEFKNSKENKMGMPMPKGQVKVFQRDSSGSLQMLGEDAIDHTPKDELLSLVVGRAFDIVVERKRTKFEYIYSDAGSKRSNIGARESYEIEIRNRKDTDETIDLIERFWGDWKVTKNSDDFTRPNAEVLLFVVPVKANSTKKVTFTVENRWGR